MNLGKSKGASLELMTSKVARMLFEVVQQQNEELPSKQNNHYANTTTTTTTTTLKLLPLLKL
jgi:hypothetical protein